MSSLADTIDPSPLDPSPLDPSIPRAPSGLDLLRSRRDLFLRIRSGEGLRPIVVRCLWTAVAGSALLGFALGTYSGSVVQILASMLKMPMLLIGTAALCFPAFYVLQSWRAPRPMTLGAALALQSTVLGTVALLWGALAPPVLFLVTATQNYRLAQFLAVVVGLVGGVVGLAVLLGGYRAVSAPPSVDDPEFEAFVAAHGGELPKSGLGHLAIYFVLFAVVGGQLSWMLRPFVGAPTLPFEFFRPMSVDDPNFFTFLLHMLGIG